jgi:hypothetical protein
MNPDQAFIVGAIVQALLYGLYLATLAHCLRWLLFDDEGWSRRKDINWRMLVIAVVIFLFSTAYLYMVAPTTVYFPPTAVVSAQNPQDESHSKLCK